MDLNKTLVSRDDKKFSAFVWIAFAIATIVILAILLLIVLTIDSWSNTGEAFAWTHGRKYYLQAKFQYMQPDK